MPSGFRRVPTHSKDGNKQLEISDFGFILLLFCVNQLLEYCCSAENVFLVTWPKERTREKCPLLLCSHELTRKVKDTKLSIPEK